MLVLDWPADDDDEVSIMNMTCNDAKARCLRKQCLKFGEPTRQGAGGRDRRFGQVLVCLWTIKYGRNGSLTLLATARRSFFA